MRHPTTEHSRSRRAAIAVDRLHDDQLRPASMGGGGGRARLARVEKRVDRDETSPPRRWRPRLRSIILVTGDRGRSRDQLVRGLAAMPSRSAVCECYDVWELLERAPAAELLVIDGDLEDASAGSLVRLLRHRHPALKLLVRSDGLAPHEIRELTDAGSVVRGSAAADEALVLAAGRVLRSATVLRDASNDIVDRAS